MKLFQIEMQIAATAYIKAETAEAAIAIAAAMADDCLNVPATNAGDVPISESAFDDAALPDVSLSPCMTIHGIFPGSTAEEAL